MADNKDSDAPQENIDKLLRESVKESLSREERRAQRISFAMGMMSHKSKVSRKQVEKYVDEHYG